VERIDHLLQSYQLPPQSLVLEVTESLLVRDMDKCIARMRELRQLGVAISLDDFGTGYSSLSYLKSFPIDTLKIDRSFVSEMLTDSTTASIIEAIISMTRVLGLSVIAEGVEDQAQYKFQQEIGCDAGQGFYISKAVPADECAKLVAERRQPVSTGAVLRVR
jgi:EAL domain-containing protein (putative c-di-GMP-specific phosphodiesterase class I)